MGVNEERRHDMKVKRVREEIPRGRRREREGKMTNRCKSIPLVIHFFPLGVPIKVSITFKKAIQL